MNFGQGWTEPTRRGVLAAAALAFLAGATVSGAAAAAENNTLDGKPPVGTISLEQFQAGYIASAGGGQGVLRFQGQAIPFSIGGVGVGGLGAAETNANGYVYGLKTLADFPGNYVQVRTGFAFGVFGGGDLTLKNDKGVTLKLKAKRKGLMLGFGGDVISITLNELKPANPR